MNKILSYVVYLAVPEIREVENVQCDDAPRMQTSDSINAYK